ncbi:MAG: hypothetical protein KKA62_01790 [Nanoarchaeota archaeon]|nr:hypothetical protein [Nanoarchaeota archaeon]MBU1644147.1 hypothetical protein [Nanoarchaeota archaeon]MBU1976665.1 hypothetical protein [Nanoarchaeota archaeon]
MYKKRFWIDISIKDTILNNLSGKFKPSCGNKNISKKAQVTVFIILGILLLLALALVVLVKQEVVIFKPEEIIPTEKGKVENFITTCLDSVGNEALNLIGLQSGYIEVPESISQDGTIHLRISPDLIVPYWAYGTTVAIVPLEEIKLKIDQYIEENIRGCLFDMEAFQESYDLMEKSVPTANTEIVESKVIFNLHWDIEIKDKAGKVVTEVINHIAESPVKLKHVYETAKRIIEAEMDSLKLEDITQDLIALEHPDVPVAGVELSCSKKTWDVNKVEDTLMELLRINIRELKIRGTDYVEFPEELTYYQNHYIWNVGEEFNYPDVSTDFNFDSTYPHTFAVTPLSGNKMTSSQLGGSDLLSFLCIQTWKFTYDLVYPVMVKVSDETTGYTFNVAFTVHLVRNTPGRSSAVARPSYFLSLDNGEDFCAVREVPMTVFTYGLVENEETGIYNRVPLENVNTSFTCLKYKCEMGQTEYDFAGMGDVAAYKMNFPYCVGGILRGQRSGYKESWSRVVTTPDKEVELNLVPVLNFPASKIKVFKHEFKDTGNVGKAAELDSKETVMINLIARKKDDLPNVPYHDVNVVKSGLVDPKVLEEEKLEFLAGTDFTYELTVNVMDEENFIGGYKGNWTVSGDELSNAEEIIFHVASREGETGEQMFELMLKLDEFSKSVPLPEVRR